jgi:hypothetical protein
MLQAYKLNRLKITRNYLFPPRPPTGGTYVYTFLYRHCSFQQWNLANRFLPDDMYEQGEGGVYYLSPVHLSPSG